MASFRNWTLDQLKSELTQRKTKDQVKDWVLTQEHVHRRERYFMQDGSALIVDQDRDVRAQNIQLRLLVPNGKPGRQGEVTKKLFPSLPLGEQLDAAMDAARQTDHEAWSLPAEAPSQLPELTTTDPRMAEDLERVMSDMTREVESAVARKRETTFNSAEVFLSIHDSELHLSNGLIHRSSGSRIYTEAAFSCSRTDGDGSCRSDEYMSTRWSVTLDDLSIQELFDETSDRAQHALEVTHPKSGKYAVIVDAEVLTELFNSQLSHLSSSNSYHGLPFIKPGDLFIQDATGDLITLTLDPSLDYGADTTALSEHGIIQKPFLLVEKNRVISTATDKRYSDYLGIPATTTRGNVVVEAGSYSYEELTRQAPSVIEILQFSGLFIDPNSGTFSSEIRLARLYDNESGRVKFIKGGSLSGSFFENFRQARFSKNRVKRAHFSSGSSRGYGFYGPAFALLSDVSIAG